MTAPTPPPEPTRLAGRYRLDRLIGRGAMGAVWEAYDEVLHRRVAIKQVDYPDGMPAAEVEQLADRTLREARAIAALSNPHVVTLYDILTLPAGPVIVMELLRARSLSNILAGDGPLTDGQAGTAGLAVADGLLAAHSAGITHRDVKPGNVLICTDGTVKLTDFGIARSMDEQTMTATGLLMGSPAYISPEVAAGEPATPAADAWGLGALLFACVQGRPPFDAGDPIATLTAVVSDPVPPHPRAGRLGPIIDRLLVKDPAERLDVTGAMHRLALVADDPGGMHLHLGPATPDDYSSGILERPDPATISAIRARAGLTADDLRRHPRHDLPEPPWAGDEASLGLAALPAVAARRSYLPILIAAVLLAVACAFGSYVAALAIGRLT